MTVQQALQTPGALLFHFANEPQPGLGGEPADGARRDQPRQRQDTSRPGAARTASACSTPATGFNYAGMIPGMS